MSNLTSEEETERVERHAPLVVSIALKFNPRPPNDIDDLISVGMIGLLKAIRTFDVSKGFQFSTYATKIITREILRELGRNTSKAFEQLETDRMEDDNPPLNIAEYLPDNLTEQEEKILYMRFYLGETFEEIGQQCGYTKQWAKNKVTAIITKIRESNEQKAKNPAG